ncbi:uncharacterized mitochondrial protein AtMg00810-like [Rutidosis leptorrhynchoides]|uniref:uncharacterized mitochondrial protein AtMg00810-like n=1 Tax=Rutidosis leptorrhynchoides TaxID=125765 RepID=UPI003A99AC7C
MIDLGPPNYFLDIFVTRTSSWMFMYQKKYASEIIERADLVGCNSSRTPIATSTKITVSGHPVKDPTLYRSLAGALHYLAFTGPNISYVVQQIYLSMHDPREPHMASLE